MTDKKNVTDKGAVELQEEQLDDASGGILIGLNQPSLSITQKVTPNTIKLADGTFKIIDGTSNFKF